MDQNYGPIPKCPGHDLPARLWLTKKEPIRQFYRCPKPIGEQCSFFAWVEPADSPIPQGVPLPLTPASPARTASGSRVERPTTPTPLPRMVVDKSGENNVFQSTGEGVAWPPGSPRGVKSPSEARSQMNEGDHLKQDRGARQRSETLRDNIPDYVRRLERKKVAAERSRDAKNSKITNLQERVERLEAEVERLKAREKELEEVIAAYELLDA